MLSYYALLALIAHTSSSLNWDTLIVCHFLIKPGIFSSYFRESCYDRNSHRIQAFNLWSAFATPKTIWIDSLRGFIVLVLDIEVFQIKFLNYWCHSFNVRLPTRRTDWHVLFYVAQMGARQIRSMDTNRFSAITSFQLNAGHKTYF